MFVLATFLPLPLNVIAFYVDLTQLETFFFKKEKVKRNKIKLNRKEKMK